MARIDNLDEFMSTIPVEWEELSNSSLILNANDIQFNLFEKLCKEKKDSADYRSDIYGGNLVAYSELLKAFFESLKASKIKPFVVFGGPNTGVKKPKPDDSQTSNKRCVERREKDSENYIVNYAQELLDLVFRNIMAEENIAIVQKPFRAADYLVKLADKHKCPILTNNGTVLFDRNEPKRGFIPFSQFKFDSSSKRESGSRSIRCKIYTREKLLRQYPRLTLDALLLIKYILLKYRNSKAPPPFLSQIMEQDQELFLSKKAKKIYNLVQFFNDNDFQGKPVDWIIKRAPKNDREELKAELNRAIGVYKSDQKLPSLEQELASFYPDAEPKKPEAKVKEHSKPRDYLGRIFKAGGASPIYLDILYKFERFAYFPTDDLQLESSAKVKYRAIRVVASLLRSHKGDNYIFSLYDRRGETYEKINFAPMDNLEGFGALKDIDCYKLAKLDDSTKLKILMATFRFTSKDLAQMGNILEKIFEKDFVKEATVCFLLVRYISVETKREIHEHFVEALMLTFFYYAYLQNQLKISCFDVRKLALVIAALSKHSIKNNDINYGYDQQLFKLVMQMISQLQHAYVSYAMLNGLLRLNEPLKAPKLERFFNGVLIFRLTKFFNSPGKPYLDQFCTLEDVITACKSTNSLIKTAFKEEPRGNPSRARRRRGRSENRKPNEVSHSPYHTLRPNSVAPKAASRATRSARVEQRNPFNADRPKKDQLNVEQPNPFIAGKPNGFYDDQLNESPTLSRPKPAKNDNCIIQ